jgi:hypothetical protein
MAPALGISAGGHTFAVRYIPEGEGGPEPEEGNTEGCESSGCHESGLNVSDADLLLFDHNDLRTYVQTLVEALRVELRDVVGILDGTDHAVPGDYTHNEAAALWNFQFIREESSLGVHNPTYAVALMTNTLEELGAVVPPRP